MIIPIHPAWRLDGEHLDYDDLMTKARIWQQETSTYFSDMAQFILDCLDDKDYIRVYTSGSTGIPKSIKLAKTAMVFSAKTTAQYFELDTNIKALHCLPMSYIAGKMMFVRAMVCGWRLTTCKPTTRPLQSLKGSYDFVAMTPAQVSNSIDYLSQIETIIIGGAAVSFQLREMLHHLPIRTYETYGMTETITHIAVRQISPRPTVYFLCLPGIKISIDDQDCLIIDAPQLLNQPIVTNDIVRQIDSTRFEWLGRRDFIINSGGVKLFPEQIEQKIESLIDQRFFIASITDKTFGQRPILIIEGYTEDKDRLYVDCSERLSKYEMPNQIIIVPKFVETTTAKIDRLGTLRQLNLE